MGKKLWEILEGLIGKTKSIIGSGLGSTEFITLRPLVVSLLCSGSTAQGLWIINSVDPCVLKSNYYIDHTLASIG